METPEQKTFHCALIDPTGKLLDCRTTSVVFPAHDGLIGVLYDHVPMLCRLGLGIMKVTTTSADQYEGPSQADVRFFVDGGFALVASNSVMVIAYDALALQGVKPEKMQSLLEKTARNLTTPTLSATQREHENERLRILRRVASAAE
jgi:F0F1-type ATP synthase epsilon subunit